MPARFLFAPPFFSSPFLRKKRTAAASEEASCIALPPGRRKLHIRWLLLPFRKRTAALGRLSVNIRKERAPSKPEVQTVPPSRQKKPAPFRFRRGGENSISAASFFLSERQPFHWVAFRFLYPCRSGLPPLTKGRWHLRSKCRRGRRTPVTARFSPFAAQTGPIPVPPA